VNLVSKIQKILLLVEGEKVEVKLLKKLFEVYNLSLNYVIYPYTTNIYSLYQTMFRGNEDCLDSLDLLLFLKSKDPTNTLFDENFSDILLIFDYEPQDSCFSSDKIKIMQNYFSESTDNGKLFLNYPMVESFKHFKSFPDDGYKDRIVTLDQVMFYKDLVAHEAMITDLRLFTRDNFNDIIIQNIKKSNYLLNNNYDIIEIKEAYFNIKLLDLLIVQNKCLSNKNLLYVLNTCLFFICDYKFDLITD
jgi:hypothetical protein